EVDDIRGVQGPVGPVEEHESTPGMTRRMDDLERLPAEIDVVALVIRASRLLAGNGVADRVEAWRQRTAHLGLSEPIGETLRGLPGKEVGRFRGMDADILKFPGATDVVIVGVALNHGYRERGDCFDQLTDIANSHTGVDQRGSFIAEDKV